MRLKEFEDNLQYPLESSLPWSTDLLGFLIFFLFFFVYVLLGDLLDFSRSPGRKSLAAWSLLEGEGRKAEEEEEEERISLEKRCIIICGGGRRARTCVSTSGGYRLPVLKEISWDPANGAIDLGGFLSPRDALGMRSGGWKLFGRCFWFCKPISSSAFQVGG